MLNHDNLILIKDAIKSLPPNYWILCQLKNIVDKTLSVQLLFTSLLPNIDLERVSITDTTYLLAGTLEQNFLSLEHDFNSIDRMIGISFISVQLVLETFMNDKSLSDVLKSNVLIHRVQPYLSKEDLLKMRVVSKETKEMIDKKMIELKKPLIIYQSKLPENFEYTPANLRILCARYGRIPKDCSLHVVYNIDPTGGVSQPSFDRRVLAQSDIKLLIKITCGDNIWNYATNIFRSLCSIVKDLKDTIYSLEIDLKELNFIQGSYDNFSKVLKETPNLTILKLSDGYIQWKPFLSCLKGITTLEELDLSDISMFTNLPFGSDSEPEDFDIEDFRNIWSESLKHLKGLRIAGYKSVISYNEQNYEDDQFDLVETVLPCLEDFTQLRSFGCNADPVYNSHMERFIPYLPYLTKITKLNLSGSNLTSLSESESVEEILRALPNLTELNLSRCQMNTRSLDTTLPAIQNLRKLRSLDISDNEDFNPVDIKRIKALFKKLVFLDIDIDGVDIDDTEEVLDLNSID
jgi:Leucine-rich repeat (LRR) protein